MYSYYISALGLTAITVFCLGIFILFQKISRSIKVPFFLYSLSLTIWSTGQLWALEEKRHFWSWIIVRNYCHSGVIFVGIFFIHFVVNVLGQYEQKRKFIYNCYGVGIFYFFVNHFTRLVVKDVGLYPPIFGYVYLPGILHPFLVLGFVYIAIYGNYLLYKAYRYAVGERANQLKYIVTATFLSQILAAPNFLLGYRIQIPILMPFGTYFFPLSVGIFVYAIAKHHLLDMRLMISRTMVFSFVCFPLLIFPIVFTFWKRQMIERWFGFQYWLFPTILEGLFTAIGLFIYRAVGIRAEQRLLRKERDAAKKIEKIINDLVRIEDIGKLARLIVNRCREGLGLKSAGIYVEKEGIAEYSLIYQEGMKQESIEKIFKEDHLLVGLLKQKRDYVSYEEISDTEAKRSMSFHNWSIAFPAFYEDDLLGILVLGHKRDGRMYAPIELFTFTMFANHVGLSIVHTRFIEEIRRLETALHEAQWMKEIGYLANALGHELRNGLQEISSTAMELSMHPDMAEYMSKNKELEAFYIQRLEMINAHIINMTKILDELSRFIRREDAGKMMAVDMQDLWRRMMVLLMARNPEMKHMKVEIEGQGYVFGNPTQLHAVLYNMINNSYDAIMKEKAVRVRNQTDPFYEGQIVLSIQEENDQVFIHVRDNGVGMDERVIRELFTPLFTTKGHIQRKEIRESNKEGTGMYRIKKIIDLHRGTIEVFRSIEHGGADFLIVLPRAQKGA